MDNLPFVLCVLAIGLTIVTLVGHGIWVVLANLGNALNGGEKAKASRTCPFCGRSNSTGYERCGWCGKDLASLVAKELSDLEAVRRQLQRFRQNGTLKPEAVDRLSERLQNYRQRLLQPAAAKRAVPAMAALIVEEAEANRSAEEPPVAPRPEAAGPSAPSIIAEPQAPADAVPPPVPRPAATRPAVPPAVPRPAAIMPSAPRPKPYVPVAPARSWSEMLAAFMEQRNIRWGELIGGLLFVCSSVALVVSLWDTLERTIPYFEFFIFVSISSAVFGVGLYAHHRWKLESTSRVLLLIATLLAPLNFVGMSVVAKEQWTLLTLASELVSLAIFALLVRWAARVLVPDGVWPVVAAVLGDSITVLLAARLIHTDSPAWLIVGTGALPAALFAAAIGCYSSSRFNRRPVRLGETQIGFLFTLLGITAFATAVALGVLAARSIVPLASAAGAAAALRRFSVLLTMTAVPVMAGGLTVLHGSRRDKELAAYHLAGTIVALVAMLVMLAAVALAWPSPGWLLAVALVNGAGLAFAAFRWRLPILHAGAIACAALAYLIAFYLSIGRLTLLGADTNGLEMLRLMIGPRSGTALGGLFVVLAAVSELLARVGRRRHGAIYLGGCTVVAVVGLLLVTVHGVLSGEADALRAAILYGVYGAGSLALTARWRRLGLGYLGLTLVTLAALWALWSAVDHVGPYWGAVAATEGLLMVAAAAFLQRYAAGGISSAAGGWFDPWKMLNEEPTAISLPRSKGISPADLYRIPLVHVGEAATMLAAALAAWTAWSDRAAILADSTPAPIVAAAAIAAVYFLLAWLYRSPARTWAASSIALAGAIHALNYNYFHSAGLIGPGWTIALLGHATLALLAVSCFDRLRSHHAEREEYFSEAVRRAIGDPLADAALLSSVVVLPALIFGRSAGSLWLACCFPWLAAVWLVLARRKRSVALFAAHQAALAFAALAAATVWMKYAGWITPARLLNQNPNLLERIASYRHVVLEPWNLQAYGIALGLLSLVWVAVRIIDLRRNLPSSSGRGAGGEGLSDRAAAAFPHPDPLAGRQSLLQGGFSVDWCIRLGVVALQGLIVAMSALAEVPRELAGSAGPTAPAVPDAVGPTAWILLGVLLVVFLATLWERWRTAELVAVLLLAATLPCLVAGRFAPDLAVASALRWTLAIGFAACSIAVWGREHLANACRRFHAGPYAPGTVGWAEGATSPSDGPRVAPLEAGMSSTVAPQVARGVLLATMVLPVLAITILAALLQIGGTAPAGPLAKTFFATLGPTLSYLVPLLLLIGALVGHALRERSSAYAFSAGLVLELAVVLGYALHTTLALRPFDATFFVTLLQLFAVTAAAWAIVLIGLRAMNSIPESATTTVLVRLQAGMAVVANGLVLGIALLVLALFPMDWQAWSVAAGRPLGWIALALPLAALQLGGRLRPHAVGLAGMAVLGLLACTIGGLALDPLWGFRTLMLGWAVYALLVVAATWWVASLRTEADAEGPPQGLIRMAAVWVRVAGILAVLLGLKAAFWHDGEQLWAAAAIAVASGAGATMAVWRRREGWAFAAALGVNLAASLVVWYYVRQLHFEDYWLRLVQANVIASAAVALVWLAARKRLYELRDMTLGESPLLALEVLLPVAGNCALAVLPVAWLIAAPEGLPSWMSDLAAPQGWVGLVLTAAVSAWYLRQTRLGSLLHVLGGFAIGAGVLLACGSASIYQHAPADSWIAYHTLTTAWAAAGLMLFAATAVGNALRGVPLRGVYAPWNATTRERAPRVPYRSQALVQPWTAAIGTLTVVMAALHAFHDPARPWWAAGAILAVSLTAGLVAMLLRRPAHVYFSGLLINLAGTIVWWAYAPSGGRWPDWRLADIAGLVQANVLCLAIGSIVWSLAEFLPRGVPKLGNRRVGPASLGERRPTAIEFAKSDGGPALAGGELVPPYDLKAEEQPPFAHLAAQLGAVLLGLVTATGVAATLLERSMPVERLDWIALAGIVAATVVCFRQRQADFTLPTLYGLGLSAVGLGLLARQFDPRKFCWSAADALAVYGLLAAVVAWRAHRARRDNYAWFSILQAAVMAVAGTLALWVAIDFGFDGFCHATIPWYPAGRMAAVPGLLLLLLTSVVMAGMTRDTWRARWQYGTLKMAVLLLSGLGWAMLANGGPAPWLHRSVIVMVASAATGLLAGFGLKRLLPADSDWIERGRQAVPVLAGLAIGMLAAVLGQEALLFELEGAAPMVPPAIAVVIAALAGLIAGCIAFAVTPEFDPLRLSDRGRQAYVYVAEALAAAIGLHVWLTMPWLFTGYLVKYWMLIVMAVAFAGAGLSEWFQRRRLAVLSQPLAQTALLLPLLPAVGFWLAPLVDESPWRLVGRAPLVWFLMALFYGVLAATRRSWKCAVLAVLSANLGLWVGLELSHFYFHENPQLFVIPLALVGLVAEYLNHDRLSEAQSAAVRYLTLSAIYVSSTADMFIAGLGSNWALPLVLMVLAVAGMLAGIMFRVRSFLFLGFTFLVLDAMSMIWYAAHDLGHTWIWFLCGIALSIAILALFALFEKRRNDVLAAVEQLKEWEK